MLFAAIPIIYEEGRGWNTLVGALPFLAVMVSLPIRYQKDESAD